MSTTRHHPGALAESTRQHALRKHALRPIVLLAAGSCLLATLCTGCGSEAQSVSSTETGPAPLGWAEANRQDEPTSIETSTPELAYVQPESEPARPDITPVAASKPQDELLQMTAMSQPRQIRQVKSAEPAQTSAQHNLALPPAQTPELPPPPAPNQTPAPQNANTPTVKDPAMADELVSVNFDGVDIRTVLKTVGEITGINFIPHQSVSGTVTVMSPTPIRLGDLYAFLQSILDVYGYAAVETENAVKIVPKAEAAKNCVQVRIGADPVHIPRNDAVVTQIIPLKYADAGEVSQIIEPTLSAGAQMATYPRTNSIMITDTSGNIHHVAQIISRLDIEGSREKVTVLPLTHASARVVSEQITGILDRARVGPVQAGRPRPAQTPAQGSNVLPDERTNSLIVIAADQDIERISQLARQLDIERPTTTSNVQVVYLKNADANEVAPSLEAALASMRLTGTVDTTQQIQITADRSTNSLVIVAPPQDFEVISGIIEKLDIIREQVMVEMQIIEVTEEALQEIGVDWATLDEAVSESIRGFGMTSLGPRAAFLSGTAEGLSVGAWKASGSGVQIGAILQALKKESGVNILSTPMVVTSNHRKATIIVGENRPFVTESRITESVDPITPTVIQGFEYRDVGITLELTPHVSQGGMVRLEVNSEFTKLIDDVTTNSLTTPVTAKRTAQTVVTMGSGATVVIGGLIRDDKTRVTKKVPLLGDIPGLGALFTSQRDLSQKTNLLIFITPHVMAGQQQLLDMTETKREQMQPVLEGTQ